MLSKLFHKKKNGFTLIELLLVCSAFAILVSGVIIAINRAYSFMNDTKIRIRATNFAREGVEMMFNIRDTNWRRHSGERDENRLNTGTGNIEFQEGLYVLKEGTTDAGDKQFYAEKALLSVVTNTGEFYSDEGFWNDDNNDIQQFEMQFEGDYSYMEYSGGNRVPQTGSIQEVLTNETEFYRIVRVFGIYCKNTDSTVEKNCPTSSAPKEMRFCVKVFYTNGSSRNSSELCSIMTNFME